MKREITFTELNNMSEAMILAFITDPTLSDEVRKMASYEKHIRSIELPEDWKLSN